MDVKEFLKKSISDRNLTLTIMPQEGQNAFLRSLSKEAGKSVTLTDILNLPEGIRVKMASFLLEQEPVFRLNVKEKVLLEVRTSGGGRKGLDREWIEIEQGIHPFSYKRAALLMDLYGPEGDDFNNRGKIEEYLEPKEDSKSDSKSDSKTEKKK